jgi:uncharacterized damage-inducible protein DinB
MASRIDLLLQLLSQAFESKAWHGPVLLGSLRGVPLKTATFRPSAKRNSIRDLVYHCAYWKHAARRCVRMAVGDDAGPDFPRSPANFPSKAERVTEKQWRADIKMLKHEHELFVDAVKKFPDELLDKRNADSPVTYAELIAGVAQHDLYHCGQIGLLKRQAP